MDIVEIKRLYGLYLNAYPRALLGKETPMEGKPLDDRSAVAAAYQHALVNKTDLDTLAGFIIGTRMMLHEPTEDELEASERLRCSPFAPTPAAANKSATTP